MELSRWAVGEQVPLTPRELDDEAEVCCAFAFVPNNLIALIYMDGAVPIVGAVVNWQMKGTLAVSVWIDEESLLALQC